MSDALDTTHDGTSRGLLDRVRADDPAAWERLVRLCEPSVRYWCRRGGLREQDAADVFQDVFQAVATHLGSFHHDRPGHSFRGWLRTVTRNKVTDHLRRRDREPNGVGGTAAQFRLAQLPAPEPAERESGGEIADRGLCRRALDFMQDKFAERTWQAFWRTTVEGRAAADVAADLRMSPGAVRVAKSRVLRRLREEFWNASTKRR